MYKCILSILLVVGAALASDDGKPVIYNHAAKETTEIDQQVAGLFTPKFTIVDIRDDTNYVRAKPIAGGLPHTVLTKSGDQLDGHVLVAYIVTTEGRAVEPHILQTTDERLNNVALKAMDEWRFEPATLKGAVIATTCAQEFNFNIETAPTEFVTQVMEPTGGKNPRPKDWFYTEDHHGPSYTWILSREDATKGRYNTGVRIQTFTDVKNGTGKTAKQFILDFVAAKKKDATKVIKTIDENNQGLFTRVGLETEEGSDHILYSLFWGTSGMDIAVVSIAGTSKELWETYAPTFDKMGAFELIDMKRFEK